MIAPNSLWRTPTTTAQPWCERPVSSHSRQMGEVGDVERHENPPLGAGEFQELLVGGAVEVALLVNGEHVVLALSQRRADPAA
jgi:hypothetical protein